EWKRAVFRTARRVGLETRHEGRAGPPRSRPASAGVAVDLAGPFGRDVAVLDVARDQPRIAQLRIAVAAAIGGHDADDVIGVDDDVGGEGVALAAAVGAYQLYIVERAVAAAG